MSTLFFILCLRVRVDISLHIQLHIKNLKILSKCEFYRFKVKIFFLLSVYFTDLCRSYSLKC